MDLDRIQSIVNLVSSSGVSEVTIRTAAERITVRKQPRRPEVSRAAKHPDRQSAAPTGNGAHGVQGGHVPDHLDAMTTVIAPMVGVFHPADPPVESGAHLERGTVIGLIESMKLMNEVRVEQSGTVREVLVEPGMPVEYGQPLFALDPE